MDHKKIIIPIITIFLIGSAITLAQRTVPIRAYLPGEGGITSTLPDKSWRTQNLGKTEISSINKFITKAVFKDRGFIVYKINNSPNLIIYLPPKYRDLQIESFLDNKLSSFIPTRDKTKNESAVKNILMEAQKKFGIEFSGDIKYWSPKNPLINWVQVESTSTRSKGESGGQGSTLKCVPKQVECPKQPICERPEVASCECKKTVWEGDCGGQFPMLGTACICAVFLKLEEVPWTPGSGYAPCAPNTCCHFNVDLLQSYLIEEESQQAMQSNSYICIYAFNDVDGDGFKDLGEPYLADREFLITSNYAPWNGITKKTGITGRFCFSAPVGYNYTIEQINIPNGWLVTTSNPKTLTLASQTPYQIWFFGNYKPDYEATSSIVITIGDLELATEFADAIRTIDCLTSIANSPLEELLTFAPSSGSTSTATTTPQPKTISPASCYKEKVNSLNREMQLRKKQALSEYRSALKSATSTTAKIEARKTYNSKIKEINNWYNQQLNQAKIDCGLKRATTTESTPLKTATITEPVPFKKATMTEPTSIELQKPTAPITLKPQTIELKVEADDYGFYPSSIEVNKGSTVILTFAVRDKNVYYGGLDFRSDKFKTDPVKPGQTTTVKFIADQNFIVSSYWPLSNVKKADLKIVVK